MIIPGSKLCIRFPVSFAIPFRKESKGIVDSRFFDFFQDDPIFFYYLGMQLTQAVQ